MDEYFKDLEVHQINEVNELWILSTENDQIKKALDLLKDWLSEQAPDLKVQTWLLKDKSDLLTDEDVLRVMRELIYQKLKALIILSLEFLLRLLEVEKP